MQNPSKRYMRRSSDTLIYCGKSLPASWFVKDDGTWEDFSEDSIDLYLTEGSQMLTALIKEFVHPELPYSSLTARELRFMLEAIIEIKEIFSPNRLPDLQRE
jgi:hypothetical protein